MPATRTKKVLLLIEPAAYVFDFLSAIRAAERPEIEAYFVTRSATQPWTLPSEAQAGYTLLPSSTFAACRRIWRVLRDPAVGLLHTAGWSGSVILCAWAIAWWRRIPIFVESDTGLHLRRPAVSRFLRRLLYPRLFRLPFRFLPAGRRQMLYLRHFGVEADRIRIHQMSVDIARVSQRVDQLRRTRPAHDASHGCQFLFVGRLEPHKGVASLVDAFQACAERHPQISLRIVGDGSMRTTIAQAAVELPGLTFEGRLEGDDLLAAYAAADVFVCPSLIEPWGLVVNEAMAARLPVIATDQVGCVDDLVADGENGLIVPAGDVPVLRDAMLQLIGDADLARRMGEASRDRIARWTMEDQARIIQQAWTEIC